MTEPNAQAQADQRDDQVAEAAGDSVVEKLLHVAAGEAESKPVEVDNVIGHIDRDRIHPDPEEWLAPFLVFPDINHEVENTEQKRAVTAGYQHVGGGPDLFDDRKLQSPEMTEEHAGQSGAEQVLHLATVFDAFVFNQQASEDAEQASGNGRQRAQQPFGVPGAVPFHSGQIFLVNVMREVDPFDEGTGNQVRAREIQLGDVGEAGFAADGLRVAGRSPHIRERNPTQQRPVTDQQRDANCQQAFEPEETKKQSGEQITKCDAIEHAHQPDVRPIVAEAAVVKNSEQEQNHASADDAANSRPPARGPHRFAQGKDERHTDDENEEGKDKIVKVDTLPVLVVQLLRHDTEDTGVGDLIQPMKQVFCADDPKHVKAPEGIQGHQPLRNCAGHGRSG